MSWEKRFDEIPSVCWLKGYFEQVNETSIEKHFQEVKVFIRKLLEEEQLKNTRQMLKTIKLTKAQCADELEELKEDFASHTYYEKGIDNLIKRWRE